MFVDSATIHIKAGNGGNGLISFRREKYVAAGGPDGGDGGRGGSVYAVVDTGATTLAEFRYKRQFHAENGSDGKAKRCFGKNGEDVLIQVPPGTIIRDAQSGKIIADMVYDSPKTLLAKGGNGGWGNIHFATPTRQAPRFAKNGIRGEERDLTLELKVIADVGLLGFPNVGKSTLLSVATSAKPKIANYHFTTLEPNLGIVDLKDIGSFVMADIPGIIEGASAGAGLGDEFLRHIERCRLLLHVVDVSGSEGRNPIEDLDKINEELQSYSEELSKKPQIVVANKTDIIVDEDMFKAFKDEMEKRGYPVFYISGATRQGVEPLLKATIQKLSTLPPSPKYEAELILEDENDKDTEETKFVISREDDGAYVITGPWIEKVGGSVNFDDQESLVYFQRTLRRGGVIDALEKRGIQEGDLVRIGDLEFDYIR